MWVDHVRLITKSLPFSCIHMLCQMTLHVFPHFFNLVGFDQQCKFWVGASRTHACFILSFGTLLSIDCTSYYRKRSDIFASPSIILANSQPATNVEGQPPYMSQPQMTCQLDTHLRAAWSVSTQDWLRSAELLVSCLGIRTPYPQTCTLTYWVF